MSAVVLASGFLRRSGSTKQIGTVQPVDGAELGLT